MHFQHPAIASGSSGILPGAGFGKNAGFWPEMDSGATLVTIMQRIHKSLIYIISDIASNSKPLENFINNILYVYYVICATSYQDAVYTK